MCPWGHIWFFFSKTDQEVELLSYGDSDITTYAQFIACWPDLFFLLLPWQPALCEFPVTLHRRSLLSVLPAFCFQPRTRQGTLQTLAQCPCVHEHEVWGVDTPWVKPLVLGSRGQWVNLLCTVLGLTALQCNSFGFFKGEVFLSKWGGISV